MEPQTALDKVRSLFRKVDAEQDYERIDTDIDINDEDVRRPVLILPEPHEEPFSWFEYSIFLLLGIAMLWAWLVTILLPQTASANLRQEYVLSSCSLLPNSIRRQR
jgi:hypothetical protein